MAISSINSGASNPYLDQNTKQADNTKQSNSTTTTSTGSANQANLDASDNDKANAFSSTDKQSSQTQTSNSVAKDSQFAASFQKSQLLSKLPNNSNNSSNATQETSATNSVSATKDLGDYGHLSRGQKKLIDGLNNRQNAANKTQLSPEKFYNDLQPSQKSTFESVTNALENTTIIGKNGSKTNGLDTIESVDVILGEKPGSKDGKEQFRLLVTLKDGSIKTIKEAKNFKKQLTGHGEEYPDSYQLKGGEPSLQFSTSKDEKKADIDVDYESKNVFVNAVNGFKHLRPSNSDVRHDNHFEKHNKRFASEPGQQPLTKRY
ncbi:MAG: hypothetical protein WAQ98_20600 [Blastocatellia bacterium]